MATPAHSFVTEHYTPRAQNYVTSLNHSTGEDLDQIELFLHGCASADLLDLGCGGGHVSYRAAPHVRSVVACDVTPSMLEAVAHTAQERGLSNITVTEAAAEALPFADAAFSIVLCRFSAHHWPGFEAGLREARRVLKPRGKAIFIDVIAPADPVLDTHLQTFELLRDPSHVRNYTLAEWTAALARAGFSLTGITPRKLPLDFPVWIARSHTSTQHADAIRSLQIASPAAVHTHFRIAPDGSFDLDTATFQLLTA